MNYLLSTINYTMACIGLVFCMSVVIMLLSASLWAINRLLLYDKAYGAYITLDNIISYIVAWDCLAILACVMLELILITTYGGVSIWITLSF